MHVAVAGGTGTVGRAVVDALTAAGHATSVLSRSTGVDVVSGGGLEAALEPAAVVIDVLNTTTTSKAKSVEFFGRTTQNLLEAEQRLGITHHVALSIVGIDRVDFGYYFGKRRQEELVRAASVGWTILRATQFHEFPGQVAARVPGPVVPVPLMRSQPVAAEEVAQVLVELATGEPTRATTDLAGPEVHRMPDLVRRWLRSQGSRRLVIPLRLPGGVGRAMAGDGLLPRGAARLGRQTFDEWLAAHSRR